MKKGIGYWVIAIAGFFLVCNAMGISEVVLSSDSFGTANLIISLLILAIGCIMMYQSLNRFEKKCILKSNDADGRNGSEGTPGFYRALAVAATVIGIMVGIAVFFVQQF